MLSIKDKTIIGPDGLEISINDLPPAGLKRWITRRKAIVVAAVRGQLLTRQEALHRYDLSEEEFDGWAALYDKHGEKGLRTTRVQSYRQ